MSGHCASFPSVLWFWAPSLRCGEQQGMSTASFSISPQYFPQDGGKCHQEQCSSSLIASLRTTPKLSGIKQYYALGFCRSITQTGQHGWVVCVWVSAGNTQWLGELKSSGGILTHILAFRTGCWLGPQLAVGQHICTEPLPMVCL